jgi:hypothetical protein
MANILGADGTGMGEQEVQPLDLTKTEAIACKKCGGEVFVQGFAWRRISKLVTNKPKDEVFPVELFLCGDCGEVLDELLPKGLKAE